MIFLAFLITPCLIAVTGWILTQEISLKEFLAQQGVQFVLIGSMTSFMLSSNTSDQEVWNGVVSKKYKDNVACSHTYSCNCHQSCSGSGNSRSCYNQCSTCYEHLYDVDWVVSDSTGKTWDVSRVDRQGLSTPPRWTSTVIGEPTSHTHHYTNYIKGSPNSLFQKHGLINQFKDSLPAYPIKVYDYWKLDRMVQVGTDVEGLTQWNQGLRELNSVIGPIKEANALIVVVKGLPPEYFFALEQHWLGGKKNDVVSVIGVDDNNNILWVNIMALSNEDFKVTLRDELIDIKTLNRDEILETIRRTVSSSYIRRPMKDFEYLSASVQPTVTQWLMGFIFSIILSVGLCVYFHKTDYLR